MAGSADTTSFSASVLAHLKHIYESSRQNGPELDFGSVQGDVNVLQTDELGSENKNLTSLASFLSYMASPVARAHRDAENSDLSSQIAHYYISSSHNTYLTGNQLYSEASAAAYTNVNSSFVALPGMVHVSIVLPTSLPIDKKAGAVGRESQYHYRHISFVHLKLMYARFFAVAAGVWKSTFGTAFLGPQVLVTLALTPAPAPAPVRVTPARRTNFRYATACPILILANTNSFL